MQAHPQFSTQEGDPTLDALTGRIATLVGLYPSRRAAAAAAGVSVDQIARYVAGVNAAPFPVLARLAVSQGVSLDWLATGRGPMRRAEGGDLGPGLEVWGLSPAGDDWYRPSPLAVRLAPSSGLTAVGAVAVLVPDDALRAEGVRAGHICYCALGSPALAGDLVLVRRADGLAALLPFDALQPGEVHPLVAPVMMVRRKW